MKAFLLCFLFFGGIAGFLASSYHAYIDIKETLASDVSDILSPLTGEKWGSILGHIVIEEAETAAISSMYMMWKREVPHKVTVKEVLTNGVYDTEQELDNYATELQHFHEQIASLDYLKGDVNQFFADMQHSKMIHDKELDHIVIGVKQTLNCDRKNAVIGITSRACEHLTSAVDKLKQRFTEVHDRLGEGSRGILAAVNDHLSLLNNTLVH